MNNTAIKKVEKKQSIKHNNAYNQLYYITNIDYEKAKEWLYS